MFVLILALLQSSEKLRPRSSTQWKRKRVWEQCVCILPALHQRGSSLAALLQGCFQDHSWEDRTLQPTIYGAFLPSLCSAATGGSGCQWSLASAGPCESLLAIGYWEVSTSGWIHPWWWNNYTVKTCYLGPSGIISHCVWPQVYPRQRFQILCHALLLGSLQIIFKIRLHGVCKWRVSSFISIGW
jgi:hypothetical protein